jgi:catechol 2,3-dioxygenase-like lactoylglutathione lyase family enzyme
VGPVRAITLDHVQVAAPEGCEEQARHFYGELLGLAEIPKPEPLRPRGGVWFGVGDRQLHIGVDPDFSPARKAHPAFRLTPAELQPLARRIAEAGWPVRWDTELPDVHRFFCEDPWGNRVELLA